MAQAIRGPSNSWPKQKARRFRRALHSLGRRFALSGGLFLDSLFLGQNRYENDRADAYFRKLKKAAEG